MSELERWEKRFSAQGYAFGKEPNAFLKGQAPLLRGRKTALSVADGEGRNGVWLAEQGLDVLTIDLSPAGVAKAQALATERGVKLRTEVADVAKWHWPRNAFDVVVAIFIFVDPHDRDTFFANLKAAVSPGGLLLIEGYRPKQLEYKTGGPSDVARTYTREILQAGFGDMTKLDIREYDAVMSEGSSHAGMSALIDLVATK
jgi:cyclopropane fatty-acyl-phospholipid synthase-like methyltransferase